MATLGSTTGGVYMGTDHPFAVEAGAFTYNGQTEYSLGSTDAVFIEDGGEDTPADPPQMFNIKSAS